MDHFSTSDGVRLAYVVDDFTDPWTSPETLVLLHAAMGSSRRLYAWVPKLARDFRVVRLDLRGHGRSEVPGESVPLTLPRLARSISLRANGFTTKTIAATNKRLSKTFNELFLITFSSP